MILRFSKVLLALFLFSATAHAAVIFNGSAGGTVLLGTSGDSCTATLEGGLRYSTTNTCLEFCDGSAWACVAPQACGDTTPNAYTITDLTNEATNTLVTSNIAQITGLGCAVNVSIAGDGSPAFRTCSDSGCSTVVQDWTTSISQISNNEYIQLRLTTSSTGGDTYTANTNLGNSADAWLVTPTGDCSSSPLVGTVCTDGSIYAGITPDGSVQMYATRCDAGMTWDGTTCTGAATGYTWNDGSTNYQQTYLTSITAGASNTTSLASYTGYTDYPYGAAIHCDGLVENGKSDWYLPSHNELTVLYNNQGAIGNFSGNNTHFWTSTEGNSTGSEWRNFTSGDSYSYKSKHQGAAVRCVRKD